MSIIETPYKTNVKWDVVTVFMYERSAMRLMCSGIWLHDLCWSVVGWGYRVCVGA